MVRFKKPKTNPIRGEIFSIEARDGVGIHTFSVKVNRKLLAFTQTSPELIFTVPKEAKGVMIIKVKDDDGGFDMLVLRVEGEEENT